MLIVISKPGVKLPSYNKILKKRYLWLNTQEGKDALEWYRNQLEEFPSPPIVSIEIDDRSLITWEGEFPTEKELIEEYERMYRTVGDDRLFKWKLGSDFIKTRPKPKSESNLVYDHFGIEYHVLLRLRKLANRIAKFIKADKFDTSDECMCELIRHIEEIEEIKDKIFSVNQKKETI